MTRSIFEPDTGVDQDDIEISEEMVIIRAKDVVIIVDPARLTRIEVRPSSATVLPGQSIRFSATCFDQHGRPIDGSGLAWSTTGGTIDPEGRYSAEAVGQYRIEASVGTVTGTTGVSVQKTPPDPVKGLSWRGTVPPQKWMNFYTKVLSRFASSPGLNLEVSFRVAPSEEVTEAKIEEAKAALENWGSPRTRGRARALYDWVAHAMAAGICGRSRGLKGRRSPARGESPGLRRRPLASHPERVPETGAAESCGLSGRKVSSRRPVPGVSPRAGLLAALQAAGKTAHHHGVSRGPSKRKAL